MDVMLFVRGALIGLAIAAPVGPIGVLCIRRTLAEGRLAGFVSGLGAASADLLYGTIAVLGLTALADMLVGVSFWTRLLGGLFLCYLGLRILREQPAERPAEAHGRGLVAAYLSTLGLTLTNPATIIAFTAIFAGLGAGSLYRGYGEGMLLVLGVAAGSALWWLTLTSATGILRTRMTLRMLRWVNLGAGLVILGFGLAALLSLGVPL
ncbi:LysE/ArgO family amino acid transporter [Candidatus Viridilinea mediisalina]|uniref:Lysine transporter LysE n=1 Tax=Candidatus Viridilinea mediisalina TaxID=2024553 RepID=A0A2A6RCU2_9CHLR|nr:LysE family transporter [Candidatus Viridilinea mediisalina]PDV98290.1 lysine transporter LysE [Candidatus Viridilinea mediisalina]